MPQRRSMLVHGLIIAIKYPGALLWTYAFNLFIAVLFSLHLHAQLASLLSHSLASQRLTSAFDIGTLAAVSERLSHNVPSAGSTANLGIPVYLLVYFILVPGALFSYQQSAPGRLSILFSSGLSFFWRFVRITLIAGIVTGLILGPLLKLQSVWATHVDDHVTGIAYYWQVLPGYVVILLIAAFLRLYFDLVEVYAVQLGSQMRPNGKPDRRIRRVLIPAFQLLRRNLFRAYLSFVGIAVLGMIPVVLTTRVAAHMLAQPRVWPIFLLVQAGVFLNLLTRFWQRGAETVIVCDNQLPAPALSPGMSHLLLNQAIRQYRRSTDVPPFPRAGSPVPINQLAPQSDPEPAAPSLAKPDPGVFHHEIPPKPPIEE